MLPWSVFRTVEFTLWEYENELHRKHIFSLLSSMISLSVSIFLRTAWPSAIQFWIIVLSKNYVLICDRTWLKAELITKHFRNKSAIKTKQSEGSQRNSKRKEQLLKIKWTRRKITCVRITRCLCYRSRYVLMLW